MNEQCQTTAKQWTTWCKVKKGAKGIPVVFWKWISEKDENDEPTGKTFPLCRYYTVFSICQTEGIDEPAWVAKLENGTVSGDPTAKQHQSREGRIGVEAAEAVWEGYEDAPALVHAGDQAAYLPDEDRIVMPCREQFQSLSYYYCTLYHEAVHSTGHQDRLDRFKSCAHVPFGSGSYSREELVAELGAAFLAGEAGIENDVILENSAAYLRSWIKVLKGEPRMAVIAAAQAQKAADHILGKKFEEKQENGA